MRPRDLIQALENSEAPAVSSTDESAELLRTMLVHVFYADAHIDEGEMAMLARVLPANCDVRRYIQEAGQRSLDLDRLAAVFPDPQDRDDIITLAEHAVWGDDRVEHSEWDIVDKLVEKLDVRRP